MSTENEIETPQPQQQEQQPQPQVQQQAPVDGVEARINAVREAEAAKYEALKAQFEMQQALLQNVVTRQPQPQAAPAPAPVDPLEAIKDKADPEVLAAFEAKFQQLQRGFQTELSKVRGHSKQQVLAAKASQYGDAVRQLAEQALARESAAGYDVNEETVLEWALGKAIREGKYNPGAAPLPPAPKPAYAPTAAVTAGIPPAPRAPQKLPGNYSQLSAHDQVAAFEAAGLDDFPI